MNANDSDSHPGNADAVHIDPENPWLGLFSYSEDTRAYFHGRDEETAELARRVQRKLLTVLFGQSGLGKTSLLRAGLVPRLRDEGYCPVYVRVDYAPGSPSPSEQIKQAVFKASTEAGHWTQPGASVEGESLWEFLHHRGDLLRDADGRTLMPLLIFDQFEEIFTLGQADDEGRKRAHRFLEDLADLVENRPPEALEARIEDDDSIAEGFDFARADYRILIALREDYLAHLEGVKSIMPSITQNRMRLARMDGAQALSAVVKPGGRLVSQEVAESIVRFVAGGSELANAEVEPSLLSLICRELNTVRQAQERSEISADLLAGSRDTILIEFYERALADQPPGVRRVVEDELLTDSGYRESLAEERVAKALAAAGASPDTLATLVNRRLLRIEERLDVRRVELTHDVLCSVVLASRELRHEREARDEAQRQLAVQQEREAATHRALIRARAVAGICAVLMVLAIGSAVFGWMNLRRARVAEAGAEKSRSDAEKLVAFLIEDFYTELEPTGRLDTLGKLAQRTVAYYDGLPKDQMTPSTRAYRAMALIREGAAQYAGGEIDVAYAKFGEAQAVFEELRAAGDKSEATTLGLALALYSQGRGSHDGTRGTPAQLQQAADLLRPLAHDPDGSRQVKQAYADTLNFLSHAQPKATGVRTSREARKILVGLGALDLTDLTAAAAYADVSDSEARHLTALGRLAEASKLERQAYELTEKVLAKRPADLRSLTNRFFIAGLLAKLAHRQHDDVAEVEYQDKAIQAGEDLVRFNPGDLTSWVWWFRGWLNAGEYEYERGEISQAMASARKALALAQDERRPASLGPIVWPGWMPIAWLQAELGDMRAAERSVQAMERDLGEDTAQMPANDPRREIFSNLGQRLRSQLQLIDGQAQAALRNATTGLQDLDRIQVPAGDRNSSNALNDSRRSTLQTAALAALRLGRHEQAEALARRWLAAARNTRGSDDPEQKDSLTRSVLAHAVAKQGRHDEARTLLKPALEYYRREQEAGAHGTTYRMDFAFALYVSALIRPTDAAGRTRRKAELAEAAALIDGASAEARQLASMREVAGLIATSRQ